MWLLPLAMLACGAGSVGVWSYRGVLRPVTRQHGTPAPCDPPPSPSVHRPLCTVQGGRAHGVVRGPWEFGLVTALAAAVGLNCQHGLSAKCSGLGEVAVLPENRSPSGQNDDFDGSGSWEYEKMMA